MNTFLLAVGAFCLGLTIGGVVENYRARVVWGFPLGRSWKPKP